MKSDSIYNIRKDLEAGVNEVISIFLTTDIKDKILLQLKELGLDKEESFELSDVTDFSRWLGINEREDKMV